MRSVLDGGDGDLDHPLDDLVDWLHHLGKVGVRV